MRWLGQAGEVPLDPTRYPRHRFPAEVTQHAVWIYHLFSLSLRDIELILAERGIVVSHESGRHWCFRFGAEFAAKLRKRRPRPGDVWHLDEVFLKINEDLQYLWRAVDQNGVVLDILVQDRRNAMAAKRFFKRLLVGLKYKPRRVITDGLRSYGAAHRDLLPEVRHRTSRHLNSRAENSHRPTRRRERQMQRFMCRRLLWRKKFPAVIPTGRVHPCVRPVCASPMATGPDEVRGSAPDQVITL
jgi:putative transposase